MKVKELIEQLQKEDPEDEIHIYVDDEVFIDGGYDRYYAKIICVDGFDINYQYYDGVIRNVIEIKEYMLDEYDYDIEEINDKLVSLEIKANYKELQGVWIRIRP